MTYLGAIKQLHELRVADDMPIYYKPAIAEVINVLLMDVQEVKQGRWIDDEVTATAKCSVCGEEWSWLDNDMERFIYCPKCGARMGG